MRNPSCVLLVLAHFAYVLPIFAVVDGTTGTPIGGLGTGAVKFHAGEGTFTFNDRTPTRYGDYQPLQGAQFQLYTKRNGTVVTSTSLKAGRESGRIMDDAVFPTHQVRFGTLNDIDIRLKAFGPFDPAVSDSMALPCAFYEFTLTNSGTSEAEVSVAFQMTTGQNPVIVSGKGFADDISPHQKCVFVRDDDGSAIVSVGSGNGFFQSGVCENAISGKTNRAAAFFRLAAGEEKSVLFVFAWYNQSDPARFYYTNFYQKATDVAEAALSRSHTYKQNAYSLVNRMRASNLPQWTVDQTLNALANLVNNSIYTADGRYCHNEGMYTMDGTMDQMWHGRQINIQLLPEIAWKELEYWARCQKKSIAAEGQIHHDFGSNSSYLIANWDETEYADYRDINRWVDLNCGFIISVYEAYIATADHAKLAFFWPYLQKAGQRILNQVALYGDTDYPYMFSTSESSYDAGGNSQAFNSGLSIVAYKILRFFALEMGDSNLASLYETSFNTAAENFSKRWLDQPPQTGNYCESMLGGPWIANFLKLGQLWPSSKLDNAFLAVNEYYDPLNNGLGYPGGSYSEWQTYLVAHLGGYALQTGRDDIWQALQFDMYERNNLDRNRVFNEELGIPSKITSPIYDATSASGSNQYISIPVVWRNYYDLVGFHRNKATGELWLEPNIPEELNHVLSNALVASPEGPVTISATESGEAWQNQRITLTPDRTLRVDTLYVKDTYGDSVSFVRVNGMETPYIRVGTGHQKRLKISWSGTVGPEGISVETEGDPILLKPPAAPDRLTAVPVSPSRIDLSWRDNAANETASRIECRIGGSFKTIGTVGADDTTFSHDGLLQDSEYFYRVVAYNTDGSSGYSNEANASTLRAGNGDVVIAINSGGPSYQGQDGIQYITDIGAAFCTGGLTYETQAAISGTLDDPLYQTERYGGFTYSVVVENGNYEATLKFAEIYHESTGARVFSVKIENATVISDLDIFSWAGKNSVYDVTVPVTVIDGTLDIAMIPIRENPKLSALVIRKAVPSGVNDGAEGSQKTSEFSLSQNYPNPFNPSTVISYQIAPASPANSGALVHVTLMLYDLLGRAVATLVNGYQKPGRYVYEFSTGDVPLTGGVYFYRLTAGSSTQTKKMIILK